MSKAKSHVWRFHRAGGLDQLSIESGADIAHLRELDPKLWVALACPVKGLELDERTLALIDTDGDGRVRLTEILQAVEFLKPRLVSLDVLLPGADSLSLSAINTETPEGRRALASARRMLANLGKADAESIACSDVADPAQFFVGTRFNGDGIIPASAAQDPALADVIADITVTQGSLSDRSGQPGVDRTRVERFFAEAKALQAWHAQGAAIQSLAALHAAILPLRSKVDDYFARCRIAAFDARALAAVNRAETEYLALAATDLSITAQEVAGFPLARIAPGQPLPLESGINPAWAAPLSTLRALAGGGPHLSETQWTELNARITPYINWLAARPASSTATLPIERIQSILATDAETRIDDLLKQDEALEDEALGMDAVEKLVRLNRDFVRLLNNFVSFGDFYSRRRLATFQCGRLYLDSRECHLCIKVEDAGKHAALAGLSRCYLAYCDLTRKGGTEKMQVLAVFTQGDSDYLMVGRNGLFVDRKGQDWDAHITRIIDAPISIRQAFFAPYKKFVRMIEEQVAKRAAAADASAHERLAANATQIAHADQSVAPAAAVAKPEAKKIDLGTIALIGTAISGIAAMVGLVLEKFFGLGVYMPLGLLAIILLISGPSMLIAALKLRQRSLAPILDANGWAINGRVMVNLPLGAALTHAAHLPAGSHISLQDPFARQRSRWPLGVLMALLLGGALYALHRLGLLQSLA